MSRVLSRMLRGAVMLALAACSGGTDDKSAIVAYTLTGPTPVRAITFRVAGKHTAVTPGASTIHAYPSAGTGDTILVTVVANQGTTLNGEVVSITIPDRDVKPTITMVQVADANYALKNPSLFSLNPPAP